MNRLTWDNARGLNFHALTLNVGQFAFAVDWVTQTVYNATQHAGANRAVNNSAGTLNNGAFTNAFVRTENNNTNVVRFEVQRHATCVAGIVELDHFASLYVV